MNSKDGQSQVIRSAHIKLPPIKTLLTFAVVVVLLYLLFSGLTYQFYASFLFLFYSWIGRMWIAVICLGIFQTLLMMPVRAVSLSKQERIKAEEKELESIEKKGARRQYFKEQVSRGDTAFLWYTINFFIQTITYFSIGRLFVTNFYTKPLRPELLYSFVSYPDYPIQGKMFKIPYPVVTKTIDLGMNKVFIFWGLLVVYKIIVDRVGAVYRKKREKVEEKVIEDFPLSLIKRAVKFSSASAVVMFFLGWFLIRNFPVGWQIKIFSGDVSIPNRTLNLITAIATFLLVIWLDISKIRQKVKIAKGEGVERSIILKTEGEMFKNSFKKALFLGIGAYFITNLIPSAFELSIFTLEIISFLSPFTLDKIIFAAQKVKNA